MQALYDLLAPGGRAPKATHTNGIPDSPGPFLIEVRNGKRQGRGRWWGPNSCGYTDQLDRAGLYAADSDEVTDRLMHPGGGHSYPVDARVIVGPACRLLSKLRQVHASTDGDDSLLMELVDPDDSEAAGFVQEYLDLVSSKPTPALTVHAVGSMRVEDERMECVVLTGGRDALRAAAGMIYSQAGLVAASDG